MQPRVTLVSSAAMRCCWLMATLLATSTFSAELLSSWLPPACAGAGAVPAQGQGFAFPVLSFVMFLLDRFSSCPRSLCMMARLWSLLTAPSDLVPLVTSLMRRAVLTNSSSWTLNHWPPPFDSVKPPNCPPTLYPGHNNWSRPYQALILQMKPPWLGIQNTSAFPFECSYPCLKESHPTSPPLSRHAKWFKVLIPWETANVIRHITETIHLAL